MPIIVGSKLPFGHTIDHNGEVFTLNGGNVGYDGDSPWKAGLAPDSPFRASGVGLTALDGAQEEAFKNWYGMTGKGEGPVKSGAIFFTAKEADARKEAQNLEDEQVGLDPIDPEKDLPKGLETDTDAPAAGASKKG